MPSFPLVALNPLFAGREFRQNTTPYDKEKALQNPEVKTEYDALQAEYDIIQSLIDARANQNITQKELSLKTGIPQADISRIENGTRNPSLSTLKKLAQGLGMQLRLEFIPDSAKKV